MKTVISKNDMSRFKKLIDRIYTEFFESIPDESRHVRDCLSCLIDIHRINDPLQIPNTVILGICKTDVGYEDDKLCSSIDINLYLPNIINHCINEFGEKYLEKHFESILIHELIHALRWTVKLINNYSLLYHELASGNNDIISIMHDNDNIVIDEIESEAEFEKVEEQIVQCLTLDYLIDKYGRNDEYVRNFAKCNVGYGYFKTLRRDIIIEEHLLPTIDDMIEYCACIKKE